jgi:hypothetical protein
MYQKQEIKISGLPASQIRLKATLNAMKGRLKAKFSSVKGKLNGKPEA